VKTLLIGYAQSVHLEVAAALSLLTPRLPVRVASPDGRPFRVAEGWEMGAELPYGDALRELNQIGAVLVPGGDCHAAVSSPALATLLREAADRRIPIGAICHGALVLAWSGVLDARRCTHVCTPKYAPLPDFAPLLAFAEPHFARARTEDANVVVDDVIVTAKPWAHLEFATTFATVVGVMSPREAAMALRSLRGQGRRAETHGYLRWALCLETVPERPGDETLIRQHVGWLRDLEAAGRLVSAGPYLDRRGGLVVITAADEAEARAIAEADPFVRYGCRTVEVRAWQWSCEENEHLGMG
jgi:uncharacterized protein YciI/putative intracellular protease/amidase